MDASIRFQTIGRLDSAARWDRFRIPFYVAVGMMMSACGAGGGSAQAPPSSISYASPAVVTVGAAKTFTPNTRGVVTHYSISPALPPGLTLDSASGVISGATTSATAPRSYTITASNDFGSTSFTWMLSINAAAPTGLSYSSPLAALVGVPLTAAPSVSGSVTSYAVSPTLPVGLGLDPVSGVIFGTPLSPSAQAIYTITASNGTGQATFGLVLSVNTAASTSSSQAPTDLSYSSPLTALVGVPLTAAPSVSGSVTSYAVSPALPAGLGMDPVSGVISGTPLSPSAQAIYTITASNGTGQTPFGLVLTVNPSPTTAPPQAPTGLTYSSPLTAWVARPLTAAPSVSGSVTSYVVSPALPAGLSLDPVSGVISGTPSAPSAQARYTITASNGAAQTTFALMLTINPSTPIIVHLTAIASDAPGYTLSYQWKTTDGTLINVNGAQTDWMLPAGPGVHFAYVMVSNGKGGYTEGRLAVNTDSIGSPAVIPPPTDYTAPLQLAPAMVAPVRWFLTNVPSPAVSPPSPPVGNVAASGATFRVLDTVTNSFSQTYDPATQSYLPYATTDSRGWAIFQNVPYDDKVDASAQFMLNAVSLDFGLYSLNAAVAANPLIEVPQPIGSPPQIAAIPSLVGTVLRPDLSHLGVNEPFFGLNVAAMVSLTTPSCLASGGCTYGYLNEYGDFTAMLPYAKPGDILTASVSIENLSGQVIFTHQLTSADLYDGLYMQSMAGGNAIATVSGSTAPTIGILSATYNGSVVASQSTPPPPQPSDAYPHDTFLAFKGTDSRLGACRYYQAIGAVTGNCDSSGNFLGAISFADWKQKVQINDVASSPIPSAVPATYYVNVVDLNITREHHSVVNGSNVAAYVCNHLGPVDASGNAVSVYLPVSQITAVQQQAVDTAVSNAVAGKNLVACVAMDYMVSSANGGKPFTRFLIFGPSGELLPSVNLDGKGEKFVPGACIACHGGNNYSGKFAEDGSGFADVGGHFLPYDSGNFAFRSTDPSQESAIYQLNQNILKTAPTMAVQNLIAGWYAKSAYSIDPYYVPTAWGGPTASCDTSTNTPVNVCTYTQVVARLCRTCHVVLNNSTSTTIPLDWDSQLPSIFAGVTVNEVCGGGLYKWLNHAMPNSANTFDRLWGPQGTSNDAPAILTAFYKSYFPNFSSCTQTLGP